MKLQNIVFPSVKNCTEESLFFRRSGDIKYSFADEYITLNKKAILYFDTYFNGFSASKWLRYTRISNVGIYLTLSGSFRITLKYKEKQPDRLFEQVIAEEYFDTGNEVSEFKVPFDARYTNGMYAFEILSKKNGSKFYGGYYYTDLEDQKIDSVNLSIVICTYKREEYIYRNMNMLCEEFLNNPESELHEHLDVVISDNSQTLDPSKLINEKIHVFPNKNAGGTGGFTRGMIETLRLSKGKNFSHVLLMDDDVVLHPESIFRTYRILTLLKPEYEDAYIGGAMLRTDRQWFQTESGGSWNSGELVSHKQGLDLRDLDACLYNEFEEKCDFQAWWYCVIPIKFIREDNLPIPIFIRGDDVEYGLRNMKYLILMNGIALWHEPFETKYSSSMYYYIFRNRLIDNAMHEKYYPEKKFLDEYREWFRNEVFTLRYKNAWLLLRGVEDYLKGIDWLKDQDGEALNKEIIESGYKLQNIEELSIPFSYPEYEQTLRYVESEAHMTRRQLTLNGLFRKPERSTTIIPVLDPHTAYVYRVGAALNYDIASKKGFETYSSREETLQLLRAYRKLKKEIHKNYDRIQKEYLDRKDEVTNMKFWEEYLEI